MKIRKASENEMLALWGYSLENKMTPTAKYFAENIKSGNAEFWTIDDNDRLIGELYLFKELEDKDFADGKARGYLCSFRIEKEYQGKGLGSRLLEYVLNYMRDCGYTTAAIGVDETEDANIRLYQRFGFDKKIKDCFIDPCAVDEHLRPKECSCFWLLEKVL